MNREKYEHVFGSMKRQAALCVSQALRARPLNRGVRYIARSGPVPDGLRSMVMRHVPVVGRVTVRLPDRATVLLETDGWDSIAADVFWNGLECFEGSTMRVFQKLLQSSGRFIDVGATTGLYSLVAAALNSDLEVLAFEPLPAALGFLYRNIALNGFSNVTVVEAALADFEGQLPLYVPRGPLATDASLRPGFRPNSHTLIVDVHTLDAFVDQHRVGRVDLIKVDTEATEDRVLAGARSLLRRDRPAVICEVLEGRTERALHAVLDDLGYSYFWISQNGLVPLARIEGHGEVGDMNYLFLPRERLPSWLSKEVSSRRGGGREAAK